MVIEIGAFDLSRARDLRVEVSSLQILVVVCNWVDEAGRMIGWRVELACSRGSTRHCCPSRLLFLRATTSSACGIPGTEGRGIKGLYAALLRVECNIWPPRLVESKQKVRMTMRTSRCQPARNSRCPLEIPLFSRRGSKYQQ